MRRPGARFVLGWVAAAVTVTAACSGGGAVTTTSLPAPTLAPSTTTQPATTAVTPTTSAPPTTAAAPAAPAAGFHGVVAAELGADPPTVAFWTVDPAELVAQVPLEQGRPGCGLRLDALADGVEVGLDPFGSGPDVEFLPWGGGVAGVRAAQGPAAATLEAEAAGLLVTVDGSVEPNEIVVARDGAVMAQAVVGTDALPFAQLHGFDGRRVLLRTEPGEPACDRGVIGMLDLATGVVVCADGRSLVAELTGAAEPVDDVTLPEVVFPDPEACRSQGLRPLVGTAS